MQLKIEELIEEVEMLEKEQKAAVRILERKKRFQAFSPEKCRRLVDRYRQLYKLSKEKMAQPFYLYHIVKNGYNAAYDGYIIWYMMEFKETCITFAKAAAVFGKHIGKAYVEVDEWKKRQDFDKNHLDDVMGALNDATDSK